MTKTQYIYIIFISTILVACISHRKTGQEYFELGQNYENSGELKNASKAYSKAIKKNNKEPNYYVKKAEMLYLAPTYYNDDDIKSYKKIQDTYNKAFVLVPWYEKALMSRALFTYRQGNAILARQDLDSLVKKYPNNIKGHLLLAEIFFDHKDSVNAIYNLKKVLEISKYNPETIIDVGEIYEKYKKYRPAINLYRTALEKSDKVSFVKYYSLAICYYRLNNIDSACYFNSMKYSKNCIVQECKDLDAKCIEKK